MNFNTSHVSIKRQKPHKIKIFHSYFNTSHVSIKPTPLRLFHFLIIPLNPIKITYFTIFYQVTLLRCFSSFKFYFFAE